MVESSAIRAITQSLLACKEKQKCENTNGNPNKQQNSGNPTVQTKCGANGIITLHQTSQHNTRLTKQDATKAKDKLDCESKNISTTLTVLAALQWKKPDAYWVFSMASSQQELSMIVHLLAPESGMISKGKQDLWHYIEQKLVPMLSKAVVDAKGEEYTWRLAMVMAEFA